MNAHPCEAELSALRAEIEFLRAQNAALRAQSQTSQPGDVPLKQLLESQTLGIFVGDLEGEVLAMNPEFERISGRERAQSGGFDWRACAPPEEMERHRQQARTLAETGWCAPWETAMLRPDGTRVPVLTGATLIGHAGDEAGLLRSQSTVFIWMVDISQRVEDEAQLRASESQMRAIVENLHDGLILADLDDTIFYANGRISEMLGYSNAELVGHNAHHLLVDAAHWDSCQERNRQRAAGQSGTYELPLRHRDGSTRWMLINGSPLRNDAGEIVGTIGAHSDFTAHKLGEDERARVALRLENSNRDLEIFACAVSHDLKQPLRKIAAFAARLQREEQAQLSATGRLYVERIGASSRRMSSLIDGLLAYSRVATAPASWSAVDLSQVAREVLLDLELAVERAGADVQIGVLPVVRASATQMRQLLQNLVGNALSCGRDGVPLKVRVQARIENHECEIEVADNGRGFDAQQAARIFEIFSRFGHAPDADGAGVGLTICRAIAERHGGTLTAQATPGQGAVFRARFPAVSELAPGMADAQPAPS